MSIEKMREEFEAWAWRYHNDQGDWFQSDEKMLAKYDNGEYVVYWLNKEWFCWQASRAALVIELPKDVDQFADDDPGRRSFSLHTSTAYRECRKAIEAAGVKVKS